MSKIDYDVLVIGGGPAGMASAMAAKEHGVNRLLLVDRNPFLGGILPQCIHDGFGLTAFGKMMTGPEYAAVWQEKLEAAGIPFWLQTTTLQISGEGPFEVVVSGAEHGLRQLVCRSIVLAAGCRERTSGQLKVPGSRPAGIFTAGAAQYMMNRQNYLPGKSVVILGLGDVGLIMARRLTLEGAKVKLILGQQAGGLLRNYIQCVRDFQIPLRLGYTVVGTHGYQRLKGVSIAPISPEGEIDLSQTQYVPCDTLLVAAGLIPETELWQQLGAPLNELAGVPVDDTMATPYPGIFACGNMVRVYDTADEVSKAGSKAGAAAAKWLAEGGQAQRANLPQVEPGRKLTAADVALGSACLVCTLCPNGCVLTARLGEQGLQVKGQRCPKGETFAQQEMTAPRRMFTSTVRLQGGDCPLLPVRTEQPVPLADFPALQKACRKLRVSAPVQRGSVLLEQIGDGQVKLLAAATVPARGE